MSKVIVVSEKGKLVGTLVQQTMIPPKAPPVGPQGPVATVLAGRGQKLHEIEIKDAELFHGRGKMDELTKLVKKQLKLK